MKTQYDYFKEAHDQVIAEMAATKMRYSVHETRENRLYKHGIQVFKMLEFHDARQWLSESYGYCVGLDQDVNVKFNEHWSFYMKFNHYMLYLKGDEELAWFKIKYGQEVE
jgi:hypothetical protein